ncbi:MAG TPA: c-type cytochrome [Acidobacteriaceae bacterium]
MRIHLLAKSALHIAFFATSVVLQGCNFAPGKPKPGVEVPRPDAVLDFPTLYQQNCSACHGAKGMDGSSYPLANPEYQALVDESTLHNVIAQGEPGTLMPAFAASSGGTLTDRQIDVLAKGIRAAWWKQGTEGASGMPPYHAGTQGNMAEGQRVYDANCASCHGPTGKAGSITNREFLALLSDQGLRTIIIAGRPDIGQPDWKGEFAGHNPGHGRMTDQNVTDVVAWLSSQRPHGGSSAAPARDTLSKQPGKSQGGSE